MAEPADLVKRQCTELSAGLYASVGGERGAPTSRVVITSKSACRTSAQLWPHV